MLRKRKKWIRKNKFILLLGMQQQKEGGKIRVNCVSPGSIEHPGENKEFVDRYSAKAPLRRKAKPEEICGSIVCLASEASSYVTDQNLVVDGGWTAWQYFNT